MKGRKHEEGNCLRVVQEKGAQIVNKKIYIPEEEHSLGNKSLGMLDFLAGQKGYKVVFVSIESIKKILKEAKSGRN